MRQTIHCLQQARHMDELCSRIFEVIHHKTINDEYEPSKSEREAIYNLSAFLDCYEAKNSSTKALLPTRATPLGIENADNTIDSVIEHEVEKALCDTCDSAAQGTRLLKNLLRFLINDKLPGANLSRQDIRLAKSALFDISLRANQLIEPESY